MFILTLLFEFKANGVDAVTFFCLTGAVVEDMAEVRAAISADNFRSRHSAASILF